MSLRSLNNRRGSNVTSGKVSGKEIDYRTSENAGVFVTNANFRIWYHMRGVNMGQWWTYWKEVGSNTLQGPLTMNDSVDGNVTTISGEKHTDDDASYNYVDINLNAYANDTAGKIVVIFKSGSDYTNDICWSGHLLTCRNGVTVNFDPDLNRQNSNNKPWRHEISPTTWATAGGDEATVRGNYGSTYGDQWHYVDYGNNNPVNYDYYTTTSGNTGARRNHEGYTGEYFLYVEASSSSGQAGAAGYPFFTVHEWENSYYLLSGSQA